MTLLPIRAAGLTIAPAMITEPPTGPNIAIARPGLGDQAAIGLDSYWGLHPVLKENLYPLYQKKQLALVPFAGTDDESRSHFETQDSIELGQPLNGLHDFQSGFMNRLAQKLTGTEPIAFTDQVPLSMRGSRQIANFALRAVGKPAVDARLNDRRRSVIDECQCQLNPATRVVGSEHRHGDN